MTYEELKNSIINREEPYISEIIRMRKSDMGMRDIADVLAIKYIGDADPRRTEDLMLNGVYNVLFPEPKDGYNIDGMRNLAVEVIRKSCDYYRDSIIREKNGEYIHSCGESFFTSGLCDVYLGVFDTDMTGIGIRDSIKREVYGSD